MRMKKVLLLMAVLLLVCVSWAGNVKVMKTKYAGADYDLMSGPFMTVNVKLLASHVAKEECACFVLVNNEQWDGDNMTISKLSKLAKTMCIGEAELEAVAATKILEIPMSISLDQRRLTGKDTIFYMKTVVVDFTKKEIIAQSDMIPFNIDVQRTSEKMLGSVGEVAFGLFGGLMSSGGGSNIPEGYKKCQDCDGKGQVWLKDSDGLNDRKVDCSNCRGKGYVEKDIWDYGEEKLHQSISEDYDKVKNNGKSNKNAKTTKKSKEEVDDGFGGLFDGLFGF